MTICDSSRLQLAYIYGGVVQYRPGETLAPRTLPDYELVLIIEGHVRYEAAGVGHAAPPGTIILGRPGVREFYRWDPNATTRHAYFHYGMDQAPSDWPEPASWPVLLTDPSPAAPALFRHILERLAAHPEWPALRPGLDECRMVECLLSMLLRPTDETDRMRRPFPEPVHHALNLMRRVLDEDPHRALHLGDLARHAGVTRKHLCRMFQQALGHPPMKTFRLMKLQLAIALLGRSNLAVKQIAARCGFDNPLYFSRCFAQTYGAPPRSVRQSLLDREAPPPPPLPPEITPRLYW